MGEEKPRMIRSLIKNKKREVVGGDKKQIGIKKGRRSRKMRRYEDGEQEQRRRRRSRRKGIEGKTEGEQ